MLKKSAKWMLHQIWMFVALILIGIFGTCISIYDALKSFYLKLNPST